MWLVMLDREVLFRISGTELSLVLPFPSYGLLAASALFTSHKNRYGSEIFMNRVRGEGPLQMYACDDLQ